MQVAHVIYDGEAYGQALVFSEDGRLEGVLSRREVEALRSAEGAGTSSIRLLDPRRGPRFSESWERRAIDLFNLYFTRVFGTRSPLENSWQVMGSKILPLALRDADPMRTLDLGSGSGRYGQAIRKRVEDAVVVDLDLSTPSPHSGRGRSGNRLTTGSGTDLPFKDGVFTLVLCLFVLEHVSDPQAVLREAARVTADHGRLILAFPSTNLWELIAGELRAGGRTLPIQHVRTFGPVRRGFMESIPRILQVLKAHDVTSVSVRAIGTSGVTGRLGTVWPWKYLGAQTVITGEKGRT